MPAPPDPSAATQPGHAATTTLVPATGSGANLFEETVERLGKSIKLGLVAPGQKLPPERELARLMGVSRSTVRAAIAILVQGGFVTARRGRGGGTFVSENPPHWTGAEPDAAPRWNEARSAMFLDRRYVLETGIAELAAGRADARALSELRALVGEMAEKLDDFEAFRACDARFHIALARAAQNADLVGMAAGLQDELGELLHHLPPSREALAHSNQQHAAIVAAISGGTPDAARAAMKTHLRATARFFGGLLPG